MVVSADRGSLSVLVLGIFIANGILWLVVPFILIRKLTAIEKRLAAIENASGSIASIFNQPKKVTEKEPAASERYTVIK